MGPDAEAINAEFKLLMSRIIARRIATDPGIIDRARAWYADWSEEDRATKPVAYWIETLEQGPEAVRRRLTARDERSYWMRDSLPLRLAHDLDCLRDIDFRRRIWRDAKRLIALRLRRAFEGYSEGRLSREDAIQRLGLRDYSELLVALGDAGLSMPIASEAEIEAQVETFVNLLKG